MNNDNTIQRIPTPPCVSAEASSRQASGPLPRAPYGEGLVPGARPPSGDPVVAVLLDVADAGFGARVAEGVRTAARHGRWRVLPMASSQERLLETLVRERRVTGVIGAFLGDRWAEALREAGNVAVVNVGDASEIRCVPSVVTDNAAVGRLAARHLLETGARSFGVVRDAASHASRLRAGGFAAALADAGRPAPESPPRGPGYAVDDTWGDWAAAQPRPLAVFCTDDFLARRLVRRCLAARLRIPQDIAVLGVGDSPIDSVIAGVPLSSVRLPAERIGTLAFRQIEAMANKTTTGEKDAFPDRVERPEDATEIYNHNQLLYNDKQKIIQVAPDGVSARESTALREGVGPLVGRALAYIEANLGAGVDVADVARACHASRRTLELAFRRDLGRGPGAELRRRRIERAASLLAETDLSPADIAHACGFADSPWFWTAFRRAMGETPVRYRARAHSAGGLS